MILFQQRQQYFNLNPKFWSAFHAVLNIAFLCPSTVFSSISRRLYGLIGQILCKLGSIHLTCNASVTWGYWPIFHALLGVDLIMSSYCLPRLCLCNSLIADYVPPLEMERLHILLVLWLLALAMALTGIWQGIFWTKEQVFPNFQEYFTGTCQGSYCTGQFFWNKSIPAVMISQPSFGCIAYRQKNHFGMKFQISYVMTWFYQFWCL